MMNAIRTREVVLESHHVCHAFRRRDAAPRRLAGWLARAGLKGISLRFFLRRSLESQHERPGIDEIADNL